jgi:hypothetical protein
VAEGACSSFLASLSPNDTYLIDRSYTRYIPILPLCIILQRTNNPSFIHPACIDTATSYISHAQTTHSPPDPLTDLITSTLLSTISSLLFPPPPHSPPSDLLQPAQTHPDDHTLIMSRRVFSDEPHMQAMLSSLDDANRRVLEAAAERERARLPLFPACFREGAESESSLKYGSPESGTLHPSCSLSLFP